MPTQKLIEQMEPIASEFVAEAIVTNRQHEITCVDAAMMSIAVSLKRIADNTGKDSEFLTSLAGTLDDASHNHQQRMRNI